MEKQKFSITKRLESFKYAFNGIAILLREEHNARIHMFVAICVCISGFVLNISSYEWIAIIMCIGTVISLEIINSAIENICDFISPEKHDQIKRIKDLAAAGVLVVTITSVAVGAIIFVTRILNLL